MELIITTPDQLSSLISEALKKAFVKEPAATPVSDRCNLSEAIAITNLSKSKIYKLTSSGEIPCKSYHSRLVFSRKELLAWVNQQTMTKNSNEQDLILAKSAKRKCNNFKSVSNG